MQRTKNSFTFRRTLLNAVLDAAFLIKWLMSMRTKQLGTELKSLDVLHLKRVSTYEFKLEWFPNALAAAFKRAKDMSAVNSFGTLPPRRSHSVSQKYMKLASCRSDIMEKTGT